MVTLKATLKKSPDKAGHYPLVIRITKDRKSVFITTNQRIDAKHWDNTNHRVRKSHPTSQRLNNYLNRQVAEVHDYALSVLQTNPHITALQIKHQYQAQTQATDFFTFAEQHLQRLKDRKQINQYNIVQGGLKIWRNFVQQDFLPLTTITVPYLEHFEAHLKQQRNASPRTVMNYFILIRTIYNRAINQGHIDRQHYPFGKGKIQIKLPESEKVGLNKAEVEKLEHIDTLTPAQNHARRVWLLSFYLAGVRVGDLLQMQWQDVRDGRLYYRMNKNQKLVSLKIPQKAQAILDHYEADKQSPQDFVLPNLKGTNRHNPTELATRIKTITRNLNRHLEKIREKTGIDKNLSMHIARHTFGSLAGGSIPIQVLQKLYRHSSITTTVNYQRNFIHEETDEALEKVVNF